MGKSDGKPKGRMSAYAYFVQTCREEHKKKHPNENVVFAEFSRKCADRWKTMSEKEKSRFHTMAEKDKKRYEGNNLLAIDYFYLPLCTWLVQWEAKKLVLCLFFLSLSFSFAISLFYSDASCFSLSFVTSK